MKKFCIRVTVLLAGTTECCHKKAVCLQILEGKRSPYGLNVINILSTRDIRMGLNTRNLVVSLRL